MLPSTVENNSLPAVPFNEEENRGCGGLMAMSPANFGIVMATGIVSLAAHLLGKDAIAQALFLLNNVLFAILCVLSILRAARYPRSFFGDMVDHLRGPGFFTTVAATDILGSQYMVLAHNAQIGQIFWAVALVLWFGFTYTIFTVLTVQRDKPTLDRGINGGWLLAVVAT